MTPGAAKSAVERPPSRRIPGEELALLVIAVLVLVLPGLVHEEEGPLPLEKRFPVAPLRIDVETAPWYEWALLEGIGEARAKRIVEFRERHGPARSTADLERIPGLPSGWTEKALEHLYFPPTDRAPAGGE